MKAPLHIRRHQSMILLAGVVVVPPDTALPISIDASGVLEPILLGAIQDLGHETPRVVENGLNLQLVSCIQKLNCKKFSHHHEQL